jgi:uncharacterized protein involved in exopolysaccharide biosynthesis
MAEEKQHPDLLGPSPHGEDASSATAQNATGRPPLLSVLTELLRRRRFLMILVLIGGAGILTIDLVTGRDYTSQAQFAPETQSQSNLAGFAAQFGIDIAGFTEGESVFFYVRLLKSQDLLKQLALHEYRFGVGRDRADTLSGTLLELYSVRGPTPEKRMQKLTRRLGREIFVSADLRAEVVTLRTTAPWPELAEQITRQALELVNDFNLEKRQSRARAEREFVERRLEDAAHDLTAAEDLLRQFLERNRLYEQSPELAFEASRLEQRLQFRQQVFTSLAEAAEEARIDAVRDTPVLTVIEQPEGSARPRRSLGVTALLGMVLGGLAAVGTVMAQMFLTRQRREYPEAYAEFGAVSRGAVAALAPSRLLAAARGRRGNGPPEGD